MLEELPASYRIEHIVMTNFQLCMNCEEHTGERAVRQITPDGKCATCGSASVMRLVEHKWPWQEKEEKVEKRDKLRKKESR
jgi:hypothetical protein